MAINLSELQQSFNSRNFNGTIFGSFVADKWVSKPRKKAAFNFKPVKQNEWFFRGANLGSLKLAVASKLVMNNFKSR